MTGADFAEFREMMLDYMKKEKEDREYYERRLEELPDMVNTNDVVYNREKRNKASRREEICAKVLNTLDMISIEIKL